MVDLEAKVHVADVLQIANDYRAFTDDVDSLGDPEDWLSLIQGQLQSLSSEVSHLDQQLAEARIKREAL